MSLVRKNDKGILQPIVKHLREFPDPPNLDQNEGVRAMRKTRNGTKQGLLTKIVPRKGAKKNVVYRLPAAEEKSLFALYSTT